MNTEGPKLHTESVPKSVEKNNDGSLTLHLENGEQLTVDCLIWAIGRRPLTSNLNLAAAGVATDEKATSRSMNIRTPAPRACTRWAITLVMLS